MDDKLLTCSEVQATLRISKSKLYRLIHKEKLPVIRLGGTFRIRQSELEKFLKDNEKIIGGTRDDY